MDGFNPVFDKKFDLIFCRGFSGANTHDLKFVSEWSNKYIDLLLPGGRFVLSYSTDFTGIEVKDETANWTQNEIMEFISRVDASFSGLYYYLRFGLASRLYIIMKNVLSKRKIKEYFYLIFTKTR